jgi:hypothetical protein
MYARRDFGSGLSLCSGFEPNSLREFTPEVEPLDMYAWSVDVVSSLSRAFF